MGARRKGQIWKGAYERDHTHTICTGNPIPYEPPPFQRGDIVRVKPGEAHGFPKQCGVDPKKAYVVDKCWWSIGQTTPSWMLYLPGIGNDQPGMRPVKLNEDGTVYKNEQGEAERYGEIPWMHQYLYPNDFDMVWELPDVIARSGNDGFLETDEPWTSPPRPQYQWFGLNGRAVNAQDEFTKSSIPDRTGVETALDNVQVALAELCRLEHDSAPSDQIEAGIKALVDAQNKVADASDELTEQAFEDQLYTMIYELAHEDKLVYRTIEPNPKSKWADVLHGWAAGLEGSIPESLQHFIEPAKIRLDPEYAEYERLRKKFEETDK